MASSQCTYTESSSRRRRKRFSNRYQLEHCNTSKLTSLTSISLPTTTETLSTSNSCLPHSKTLLSSSYLSSLSYSCFFNNSNPCRKYEKIAPKCYSATLTTTTTMPKRHFSTTLLNWTTAYRILTISLLIRILSPSSVLCVDPKFDPSTRMRLVLVPADAQVGSVIYRLRATDEEFEYPLTFEFLGDASSSTVKIESLPCTKYNSVCQANVILSRRLEPGRYYDFQVSVKDTKGGTATQLCSITATNFTTPHDLIFPHKPGIIMIPEVNK